jgi:hypothetical protein
MNRPLGAPGLRYGQLVATANAREQEPFTRCKYSLEPDPHDALPKSTVSENSRHNTRELTELQDKEQVDAVGRLVALTETYAAFELWPGPDVRRRLGSPIVALV